MQLLLAWALAAAVISMLLTGGVRRLAQRSNLLDIPNDRSSHTRPTPRGGGAAIVLGLFAVLLAAWLNGLVGGSDLAALVPGVLIAVVGLIDDRRPVPARRRLIIHLLASLAGVLIVCSRLASLEISVWAAALLVGVLAAGVVWSVNLFNFMDGIDGIAGSEAVFVALTGGLIEQALGAPPSAVAVSLIFAGSLLGFLTWNWPPARIFMGDVGSGFIGYGIAILALLFAVFRASDFYIWMILSAVFVSDSTVTLVTRYFIGNSVMEAHRTHAYQRLAIRFGSHAVVTIGGLAINLVWLLPLAIAAGKWPAAAPWATFLAYLPLVWGAIRVGAGRRESVLK